MTQFKKTLFGYKKEGSNKQYKRKTINMPIEQLDSAIAFLNNKIQEFTPQDGYGVLLYVYYTKDRQSAEAQLFKFSNYSWEVCSESVELSPVQLAVLLSSGR